MGKTFAIKSGIILIVLALIYSVFWFFKTGQIEKQISGFISENSSYISAGEVEVSGFPLSQKVVIKDLKFSIQNPIFSKYKILIKTIEANSGIFSNNFAVTIREQISVQNSEDNSLGVVEFNQDPEISISISDGIVAKFNYKDAGYRIVSADKNVLYAASSTILALETAIEEGDKIRTKISGSFKDIEGFSLLSIYKNAAEKKIAEGIKTGEIFVNNSAAQASSSPIVNVAPAQIVDANAAAPAASNVAEATKNPAVANANPATSSAPVAADQAAPAPAPAPAVAANVDAAAKPVDAANPSALEAQANNSAVVKSQGQGDADLAAASSGGNLVKSNIFINAEYVLIPNQNEQKIPQIPSDPTQIQETPVQYSKVIKINSLEFSNPLYKIEVNGQMNSFLDDNLPSGSITVKVTGADNLISYFVGGFSQIIEQKKSGVVTADMKPEDVAAVIAASPIVANTGSGMDDSYTAFLKRVVAGLPTIAKEVALKNAVSKDDVEVFDIRREKNLEFLVNETSTREILGKF